MVSLLSVVLIEACVGWEIQDSVDEIIVLELLDINTENATGSNGI